MRILVLNGPNLNRLGTRQPDVYGTDTLDDIHAALQNAAGDDVEIDGRQTNHEGDLVGWLHEAADTGSPVILNAGALTHTSVALHDAIAIVIETGTPVVEVHLSNPHRREAFRQVNFVASAVTGSVTGFGLGSYLAALTAIQHAARPGRRGGAPSHATATR
ncbi:3-dehydroquinate dehydratase [Pseudoclavibacter endophyticus]|uniref:3-dehydroquinate dehydratase n=1 Tax=Pseudoclavibacter endophyticus TaxID=1778590 RepID=A0A6H9WLQ2_9MICO|nr:type II 3-dehydroquinate dehydratase [Pseudoclavibacter endophyticus]KAB1650083.1 3-dehydroquinate dehydratase [Pseudoclavibacter endophyticus]GGA57422.1 3-dehydroquinate dehydratase [Pseudoclavibacter endophyticus]